MSRDVLDTVTLYELGEVYYCLVPISIQHVEMWEDGKGWEIRVFVPTRYDVGVLEEAVPMSRDEWPEGLADVLRDELAKIDTSEPDVWKS